MTAGTRSTASLIALLLVWPGVGAAAGESTAVSAAADRTARDAGPSLDPAIARHTAAELHGTLVEDRAGAVIGKLTAIVRGPDEHLLGIVHPNGLDGGEARGAAYPLRDFGRRGERLTIATAASAERLMEDPAGLAGPDYEAVIPDVRLAHLVPGSARRQALEAVDPIRPFSDLDQNHDGVLSPSEAHASPRIGRDWTAIDLDGDGVIDASEFRAIPDAPPAPSAREDGGR